VFKYCHCLKKINLQQVFSFLKLQYGSVDEEDELGSVLDITNCHIIKDRKGKT